MLEKTLTKHRKNVWDSVNFYPIYPGKKCQNTDEKTLHKHSKNTRKNTRKTLEKGLKKPQKTHIWFVTFFHLFFVFFSPFFALVENYKLICRNWIHAKQDMRNADPMRGPLPNKELQALFDI
jgi:hypothetical protein